MAASNPAQLAHVEKKRYERGPNRPKTAAGVWTIKAWTAAANLGFSTWWTIDPRDRPHLITVGRSIQILESPEAWRSRMAAQGGRVRTVRASAT